MDTTNALNKQTTNHSTTDIHNLLLRIFKNILNDPNNERFRKLNYKRVAKKLSNSAKYLSILFRAGFQESTDGKSLLLDRNKLESLSNTYSCLIASDIITPSTSTNQPQNQSGHGQFDSKHLLNSSRRFADDVSNRCNLNNCKSLKVIGDILKGYNEYIQSGQDQQHLINSNRVQRIYRRVDDKYNNISLLNDFNHLLSHHQQFEDIHDRLQAIVSNGSPCNISKCLLFNRNGRNRSEITSNENTLRELYYGNEEVVEQQLIDRIHCHFFHTFDIGYKLTNKDKQNILNQEQKMDIDENEDITYDYTLKKLDAITQHKSQQKDIKDTTNKFATTSKLKQYQYGTRFFYWDYYKNYNQTIDPVQKDFVMNSKILSKKHSNDDPLLRDWYVNKKYNTLKEELTNNEMRGISDTQWHNLYTKSKIHSLSQMVREIYCPRKQSSICYDMKYRQIMSKDHLIALMIYCNYDQVQSKFTATFWKDDEKMTDDEFKRRHSNYYFLAKLLRECVECFGMKFKWTGINPWNEELKIFHGVGESFVFESIFAHIKGPFSTSRAYCVAFQFCDNIGMILELTIISSDWFLKTPGNGEGGERLCCFDCEWISDFSHESEILFLGGLNPIIMQNIIEVSTSNSYRLYVNGLRLMTTFMSSVGPSFSSNQEKNCVQMDLSMTQTEAQMVFRLLSHRLFTCKPEHKLAIEFIGCCKYIQTLLNLHCQSIRSALFVKYESIQLTKNDYYNKLWNKFFFELNGHNQRWINFEMIMIMFPNCELIKCKAVYDRKVEEVMFDKLLLFIQHNPNSLLQRVVVDINGGLKQQMIEWVKKYCSRFKELWWMVCVHVGLNPVWLDTAEDQSVHVPKRTMFLFEKMT